MGKCVCVRYETREKKKIGMSAIERKLMFPIKQREQKKKEKEKEKIQITL